MWPANNEKLEPLPVQEGNASGIAAEAAALGSVQGPEQGQTAVASVDSFLFH